MNRFGKKVCVLGLGISGYQSALFLRNNGFDVFCSDKSVSQETMRFADDLKKSGIDVETGVHSVEKILGADWILISPGISPFSPLYLKLQEANKIIISEIELASYYSRSKRIIAVTGTAGKTTAATLIGQWLKLNHCNVVVCGNIGNPWIGELERISEETFVVLEVSSFQLFHCKSFSPQVGILLNVGPNHLDWHKEMEHYVSAKLNLFQSQTSSALAIFRHLDQTMYFPSCVFKAEPYHYDKTAGNESLISILEKMCAYFSFPKITASQSIHEFKGIDHRLEVVGVFSGVKYINDSKCTTPMSLRYALEKMEDGKVILLAGGKAKSKDFDTLQGILKKKVKCAVVFGECAEYLERVWRDACLVSSANNLEDSLSIALQIACAGDTVLLSPACASFDQFANYQERGRKFKEKVISLVSDKSKVVIS